MSEEIRYGMIEDEPIEVYHACKAISRSKIDDLINCTPEFYYEKHVAKTFPPEEEKTWAVLGNAIGCLTLEGEEAFKQRFIVEPTIKKPTKAQREAKAPTAEVLANAKVWDDFEAAAKGKSILSVRELHIAEQTARRVHEHPVIAEMLSRGKPEVTFRYRGRNYDLQCRTDWVCLTRHGGASPRLVELLAESGITMEVGQPYALDLKSTANLSDLTEKGFDSSFTDFGYHRQGPFYRSVIQDVCEECIDHFFFAAVEKREPFAVSLLLPSEDANERGWNEIVQGLSLFNRCRETGTWPGLTTTVRRLGLTNWYKSPLERKERA